MSLSDLTELSGLKIVSHLSSPPQQNWPQNFIMEQRNLDVERENKD